MQHTWTEASLLLLFQHCVLLSIAYICGLSSVMGLSGASGTPLAVPLLVEAASSTTSRVGCCCLYLTNRRFGIEAPQSTCSTMHHTHKLDHESSTLLKDHR